MTDMVLENALVREYLRALSLECISLPVAQARELREQIAAHLDEALPADATNDDVQAELARLGSPRSLAAAAGPARFGGWRRLRNWLSHVRWWGWALLALVVAMASTGAGFFDSMKSAAPLYSTGTGWLYPADQARAVDSRAGLSSQTTVPVRSGQRQGIELAVWNTSDWTQIILGTDPHWYFDAFTDVQITGESGPRLNKVGDPVSGSRYYASPAVIPPHSFRWLRVTWISQVCLVADGYTWFGDIPFLVRVGAITKTEDVTLDGQNFALAGPSTKRCS